jgi:hypothetical protein
LETAGGSLRINEVALANPLQVELTRFAGLQARGQNGFARHDLLMDSFGCGLK